MRSDRRELARSKCHGDGTIWLPVRCPHNTAESDESIMHTTNVIERAYELTSCLTNIDEIRKALRREGFSNVDAHLAGPKIRSDLQKLIDR